MSVQLVPDAIRSERLGLAPVTEGAVSFVSGARLSLPNSVNVGGPGLPAYVRW
jgi:hypothetical protein